jgi:hypothetical protein
MVVAGYSLHLYCDCANCESHDGTIKYHPGFAEYTGNNWLDTARKAKKDGWYISSDKLTCFSPGHERF